jgi:hypothetical protein
MVLGEKKKKSEVRKRFFEVINTKWWKEWRSFCCFAGFIEHFLVQSWFFNGFLGYDENSLMI